MQFGGAQRVMTNLLSFFSSMDYSVLLINDILPQKDIPEYPIDGRVQRLFLESKDKNFFLKNINKIIKLRKIIQKEKPDFVVSFLCPPNFRLILAAIGLKCKVIVSVRNDPYYEYGSGIKKFLSNRDELRGTTLLHRNLCN